MSVPATPFTDWQAYSEWANQQVCRGCGAAFKDRPKDADGKAIDIWVTEYECIRCFSERCASKSSNAEHELRLSFIRAAMQGLCSNPDQIVHGAHNIALGAIRIADATLAAARGKT